MAQLYARVHVQILDSSIAEDFTTRHIFEDFFKLAEYGGIVDMTRQAISRRLNVPLDVLNTSIAKMEEPDPNSRDPENEGRRIQRLDQHRDWGWKILNWEKYEAVKNKADAAIRVARHRSKSNPQKIAQTALELSAAVNDASDAVVGRAGSFSKPTLEAMKLHGEKIGLPLSEIEKCFHYYESNGWKVGRNPMKSWQAAMINWRKNWEERGKRCSPESNQIPETITVKEFK